MQSDKRLNPSHEYICGSLFCHAKLRCQFIYNNEYDALQTIID